MSGPSDNRLTCPLCDTSFESDEALARHRQEAHGGETSGLEDLDCKDCNQTFKDSAALTEHFAGMHARTPG